ncbi:MAG: hypothetical protein ISR90_01825 [Candidatus Marinimicrobia bacterium]|nr:hypothetical protein [Candidatus Neomarinimicrobiota bacterium]MBL7022782.1 hypothetical protein [Candidatus Neomarinimicrobiota bacterium]MBL7109484.1 hypothetical protein [Candidatus Neomarinimicrobiota bacterium]
MMIRNLITIGLTTLFLFGFAFSQTNAISKRKIGEEQTKLSSDSFEKKYHRAKALENAKLIDDAKKLYLEINRKKPGVTRYFTPLKNIYRQQRDWKSLIEISIRYTNNRPNDFNAVIDLAEVYLLADSTQRGLDIFRSVIKKNPKSENIIKQILPRLIGNRLIDDASSILAKYRNQKQDSDFYALEMGSHFARSMAYDKAMEEYLLYLGENPTRVRSISDRIVGFPNSASINKTVIKYLTKSSIPQTQIILSDIQFKNSEYEVAFNTLINSVAPIGMVFELGTEFISVNEFPLAISVFEHILNSSDNKIVVEQSIYQIGLVLEKMTVQKTQNLPLSGFYKDNPFFSTPFLRMDESASKSLWKAVSIYDSLFVNSKTADAAFRLGEIHFRILGDIDGAENYYKENSPSLIKSQKHLDNNLRLADIQIVRGNLVDTEEKLSKLILRSRKRYKFPLKIKLGQVYFYQGKIDSLQNLFSEMFDEIDTANEYFNDLAELSSFLMSFDSSPDLLNEFVRIQHLVFQNKRTEAIAQLKSIEQTQEDIIANMAKYQSAYLNYLQGDFDVAVNLLNQLLGDNIYLEKGYILSAEIQDYVYQNLSQAVDIYLKFLELYPNSIYYDNVRKRLREIAG